MAAASWQTPPARAVAILVDTSGSMKEEAPGDSRPKYAVAQEALAAIERLPQSSAVLEQSLELLFGLRTSPSPLGEFRRIFELLREAEMIATTLNDRPRLARVLTFKALYFWSMGQQDRTMEATEQAAEVAGAIGDLPAQVLANLFAGRALHALIGYTDQPTAMQLVVYLAVLATMFILMKVLAPPHRHRTPQAAE